VRSAPRGAIPEDEHPDLDEPLRSIRSGEADALVVLGPDGEEVLILQGADEPYRVVVETMSEGALVVDARDRVVYANPSMRALVGVTADPVVGTRFDRLFAADQASLRSQVRAWMTHPGQADARLDDEAGVEALVTLSGAPLRTGSFEGTLVIVADITRRRLAERGLESSLVALTAANERLERMGEAKDNFLATVSHEFRTALFGIQGYSEMLSRRECSPAAVMQYAGNINHDVRRLGRLISDVLDLARMESGQEQLRIEEVDLSALIAEAAGRAGAGTDRHDFEINVAAGLPPLLADRDRLAQVLANLLANAVKYSPAGGEIAISAGEHPEGVLVEVRDQGMGISPDLIDDVFEPYRRSEAPGTRAIKGTGLGLPIVRHIVDLHGGRAWAESEQGAGSTFRFTLPLRPPESDSSGVPHTRGQPEAAVRRSTQIGR
jgi:PAS domain S-box-containing protein